jgi:hypothetical protein
VTAGRRRAMGEWGPEQVHPLLLGASGPGAPPSPLAGRAGPRDLASLFESWTLSGPNACRRRPAPTPAFGRRPACVPEPIGKLCFSGEPADPGRQSRLTFAATVRPLAAAGSSHKVEPSVSFFQHHLQLSYGYCRNRAANRFAVDE